MSYWYSVVVRSVIALSVVLLLSCGGSSVTPLKVELNGDSIVYGQGLDVRPSVYLQSLLPDVIIEDKSQVGLTLDSLVRGYSTPWVDGPVPRLGTQPPFNQIERTADIVVISLGGNDAYAGLSPDEFEVELREVIQVIKGEGRVPVLTGIVQLTPSTYGFDYPTVQRAIELNERTKVIAKDMNVINVNWDTVEYNGLLDTLDGIHRTQQASNLLIERLALVLKSIRHN